MREGERGRERETERSWYRGGLVWTGLVSMVAFSCVMRTMRFLLRGSDKEEARLCSELSSE